MLLHLSPQAEFQSHLCDWCCLWTTSFPTSCLSFHAASLEKMRSWSSLEVTWLSFSLFPCCLSYCGQFKEWTEINTFGYQNWSKLMGCSALSFTIKSFSDNDCFGCCYNEKKQFLKVRSWEAKPCLRSSVCSHCPPRNTWMWWLQAKKC